MPLDPKSIRAILKGEKNPVGFSSENKSQVTVVACISIAWYCIPPMVIWDRKNFSVELAKGEDMFYGLSENGWMDQELFDGWSCSINSTDTAPFRWPFFALLSRHHSQHC